MEGMEFEISSSLRKKLPSLSYDEKFKTRGETLTFLENNHQLVDREVTTTPTNPPGPSWESTR